MKRCPGCGRDYNDDSLSFCLDDGSELLFGPGSGSSPSYGGADDEPVTAVLYTTDPSSEVATQQQILTTTEQDEALLKPARKARIRSKFLLVAVMAAAVGLGVGAWYLLKRAPLKPGANMQMSKLVTGLQVGAADISISPDGKYVAYSVYEDGKSALWLRQVSQDTAIQIVPATADAFYRGTVFSPDSEVIYFAKEIFPTDKYGGGALYSVPVVGGKEPRKLIDNVAGRITLSPDGRQIAFQRRDAKADQTQLVVAPIGGTVSERVLVTLHAGESFSALSWSPDGKRLGCSVFKRLGEQSSSIFTVPVEGGELQPVGSYKFTGFLRSLVWLNDGTGFIASAREPERGETNFSLWEISYPDGNVEKLTRDLNDYFSVGLTANNHTAVMSLTAMTSRLWLVDADGNARKLTNGPVDGTRGVSLASTDRLIYSSVKNGKPSLWTVDLVNGGEKELKTTEAAGFPISLPDGDTVIFTSPLFMDGAQIWRFHEDGSGLTQLTNTAGISSDASAVSRDGTWVLFTIRGDRGEGSIWKVPVTGGESVRVSSPDIDALWPSSFSADDKLVICKVKDVSVPYKDALLNFETGKLIRFLDLPDGAYSPRFSPNGKEIVYVGFRGEVPNLWARPVAGGQPRQLTRFTDLLISDYAVSPDGRSFAVVRSEMTTEIVLVRNFR